MSDTQGNESQATVTATPDSVATTGAPVTSTQVSGVPNDALTSVAADKGPGAINGAVTAGVPSYQPNFKFETLGKELEFDEWAKGVIKDPDTEKKVRELYEKAYGLDAVKTDRQTLRSENTDLKRSIGETEKTINTLAQYAKSGDWDSFFKAWDIPVEKILQYAVNYAQRTPEQQQALEDRWRAQQGMTKYEQELAELRESNQQLMVQQRSFELDSQLSKPDIVSIAEAFDARVSQPGAFRAEVIRRGQLYAAQGQDISAEQAVREVQRLVGNITPSMDGQQAFGAGATTQPKVVSPNQKPTIPNITGRGASAVKKSPKSIEDLRKLSDQFANSGA